MIQDLCQRIKDKRRDLGYSIEEVVKKTKLHPSVVKDIEACNLGSMTPVFAKGFIKIYASFLGVELGDDLEQLRKDIDTKAKSTQVKREKGPSIFFKFFNRVSGIFLRISPKIRKNILLALIVILIFWLGFLGIRFSFRMVLSFFRSRPQVEKEQVLPEAEKPPAFLDTKISQITASLTAKRDCFIRAFVDGEVFFEGVLRQGEVKVWRAKDELEFQIRDASAIQLEVDGEPIPRISSLRQRKTLIINSSGITIK